jgi:uncharacterized protein
MSKVFQNLEINIEDDLEEKLALLVPNFSEYRIQRKSVDARGKPHFVYTIEVFEPGEKAPPVSEEHFALRRVGKFTSQPPIVIGAGPAGLFAALRLVECGIPCRLFEQGADAQTRVQHINQHWRYGKFNKRSNVCFGEGGAGLYSDGKLITRIKSPHIPYILNRLVKFGAPAEIEYLANPHVGSDKIRRLIPKIREFLIASGCEIHLNSKVQSLLHKNGNEIYGIKLEDGRTFESAHIILATGHSAEDIFSHLKEIGVFMEGKSFAMGLRIEHPQKLINKIQYREYAENVKLGAANYRLAHHDHKTGVGVYSFCMCPGGYVISSISEDGTAVCNGMSNFNRGGPYANAAIVVSIDHPAHFGKEVFGGMNYRRDLETKGFNAVKELGNPKSLPVQSTYDFVKGKNSELTKTSSPSGVVPVRLDKILPPFMREKIVEGLEKFETQMPGFLTNESQLHGLETRTSCPIRVTRDKITLQSLSHRGLYPVGEGAGYAGGITSAAVDGVRAAEALAIPPA